MTGAVYAWRVVFCRSCCCRRQAGRFRCACRPLDLFSPDVEGRRGVGGVGQSVHLVLAVRVCVADTTGLCTPGTAPATKASSAVTVGVTTCLEYKLSTKNRQTVDTHHTLLWTVHWTVTINTAGKKVREGNKQNKSKQKQINVILVYNADSYYKISLSVFSQIILRPAPDELQPSGMDWEG